jgi:hypothetical protein
MERNQILRLFEAHREAEPARDIDGILSTFVPTPFLETVPLGLRSEGRDAVRAANEIRFFTWTASERRRRRSATGITPARSVEG